MYNSKEKSGVTEKREKRKIFQWEKEKYSNLEKGNIPIRKIKRFQNISKLSLEIKKWQKNKKKTKTNITPREQAHGQKG